MLEEKVNEIQKHLITLKKKCLTSVIKSVELQVIKQEFIFLKIVKLIIMIWNTMLKILIVSMKKVITNVFLSPKRKYERGK